MRLFSTRRPGEERLLWSRDTRFLHRVSEAAPEARLLELDSGAVLIGPGDLLTDALAAEVAADHKAAGYGLVAIDSTLPERDRYLFALSAAVQASGLADRIGMAQTTHVVQGKMLDYFFALRGRHAVAFQPIVELPTGTLFEYECLFRPDMPMLPQSISSVVQAAIDTGRAVELDSYVFQATLTRVGELDRLSRDADAGPLRVAINLTPASFLDPRFEASRINDLVRAAGLHPRQVTLECTEQQAVADVAPLKRQVKACRRLGFGFAVDDAGAGYASFTLIAALRPTLIKIDRDIVHGIARDDAKQALVEAFVSFGRRIGARLVAEGIEKRVDLAALTELGVDYGQGFLLGRPALDPAPPRRMDRLGLDARGRLGRRARVAASPNREQGPAA
ncbi:MAG: EAL domain-containing protein [Chloroflexota bacterium]